MTRLQIKTIALSAATLLAPALPLQAQTNSVGAIQADVTATTQTAVKARRFPTVFSSPSAVGGVNNVAFIGATYVNPRKNAQGDSAGDGDIVFGYSFGNVAESLAVTTAVAINSVHYDDFADSGGLSLSASRLLSLKSSSATFLGAAANNLAAWGDSKPGGETYSIYGSHVTTFGPAENAYPVQFTLGYGSASRVTSSGSSEEGLFGGAGVGLTRSLGMSFSFTQSQLNLGLGASFASLPGFGISTGVLDVTDNTDNRQFALSLSYGF